MVLITASDSSDKTPFLQLASITKCLYLLTLSIFVSLFVYVCACAFNKYLVFVKAKRLFQNVTSSGAFAASTAHINWKLCEKKTFLLRQFLNEQLPTSHLFVYIEIGRKIESPFHIFFLSLSLCFTSFQLSVCKHANAYNGKSFCWFDLI